MSTIALPRTLRENFSGLKDPALLIPLVGTGVLIYLAVMPLFMLLRGSFEMEVAPREFVWTWQNYRNAYASQYTYTTFRNSIFFAEDSSALAFGRATLLTSLGPLTTPPSRVH